MARETAEASRSGTELQSRRSDVTTRFSWRRLGGIAARQHNLVSLEQLVSLGLTPSGARSLVAAGKLRRIHRGVYGLGAAQLGPHGNWAAAVLACGRGSLLAGRSAGALIGIATSASSRVQVISPRHVRRRHDGIAARTCTSLLPRDRMVVDLIPCTSVPITLLQMAATDHARALDRALEQSEVQGLLDLRGIEDVLDRHRGRRGARRLRAAVRALGGTEAVDRRAFEDRFAALTPRLKLPVPARNVRRRLPDGIELELDFLWPDLGLAVELDGLGTHGTRSGRRKDRSKDRRLAAVGIQVIRFIWEDLDRPREVVAEVEAIAAQRRRERMNSIASATSSVSFNSSS